MSDKVGLSTGIKPGGARMDSNRVGGSPKPGGEKLYGTKPGG